MKLLTLTPDAEAFAVAALVVYALACAPLTGYLQLWWPGATAPPFLPLYAATMATVATAALVVLSLPTVTGGSASALALALPLGIAAGGAAVRFDAITRRRARRRRLRWRPSTRPRADVPSPRVVATLRADKASRISTLGVLTAVAALEELLFRGLLVDLSLNMSSRPLAAACLAGTIAMFGLSHVWWGWSEVVSKSVLGVLALATVLALGTVVPAVVAHVVFNTSTWRAARARSMGGSEPRGSAQALHPSKSAAEIR